MVSRPGTFEEGHEEFTHHIGGHDEWQSSAYADKVSRGSDKLTEGQHR